MESSTLQLIIKVMNQGVINQKFKYAFKVVSMLETVHFSTL